MAVFPETEVQALGLGHAPGRYTLAEIDTAIAKSFSTGSSWRRRAGARTGRL